MKQITLDWDDWHDAFEPLHNPNENADYFETYGEDVEKVKQAMTNDPRKVWTRFDDGNTIGNGYHYVNRLAYYITKHALVEGVSVTVVDMYDMKEQANRSLEEHAEYVGLDLHDKSERTEAKEDLARLKEHLAFAQETLVEAKDYVA